MKSKCLLCVARINIVAAVLFFVGCSSSAPPPPVENHPRAVEATDVTHIPAETKSNVMYFPTDDRRTTLLVIEQVGPREIHSGVEYTYQLKVTNRADVSLQNVVLRAACPMDFNWPPPPPAMQRRSPTQRGGSTTMWASWARAKLRTFQITGTPTGTGSIHQTFDVVYERKMNTDLPVTSPAVALLKTAPKTRKSASRSIGTIMPRIPEPASRETCRCATRSRPG